MAGDLVESFYNSYMAKHGWRDAIAWCNLSDETKEFWLYAYNRDKEKLGGTTATSSSPTL